jgi:hypothetical protein
MPERLVTANAEPEVHVTPLAARHAAVRGRLRNMDWIDFLDKHAGAVTALATIVLVMITAWYAWLTRKIAKETSEARRPYVYVDISGEGGGWVELVLGNDGDRAAGDIKVTLRSCNDSAVRNQFANLEPLQSGLSHLAVGRRYRYGTVLPDRVFDEGLQEHIVVVLHVAYGYAKRRFEEDFRIDLTGLRGVLLSSFVRPDEAAVKELRGIARNLGEMQRRSVDSFFTQACPSCASKVDVNAKKCPHCWELIPATRKRATGKAPKGS